MNLVNQSVRLMNYTPDPLETIEMCGRICYKSEKTPAPEHITKIRTEEFIRRLINRGHESVLEHVTFTFHLVTSRGVSHELVRHRTGIAFSQESTRYCNYNRHMEFIIPNCKSIDMNDYIVDCQMVEDTYKDWIDKGISPQFARTILTNGLKTEIFMTVNVRELRHILKLRLDKAAHPDMIQLMELLVEELQAKCKDVYRVLFSDITEKEK